MVKKNIILVLIASMLLSLCSCQKDEEVVLGSIDEVGALEKEYTEGLSLFEKQEDLGLSYVYNPLNLLGLEMEMPSDWDFSCLNARHFKITDGYFTIQILGAYINTGDDIILTYEAEKFFDEDLEALTYSLENDEYYEVYRQSPSSVYSKGSLVKDTNYSVIEYENPYLENSKGESYSGKSIAVHMNFKYKNAWITVRSLVKSEDKEYITSLMLRLISGIRECETTKTLKECQVNNINLKLPDVFYISQNSLPAAFCPSKTNSEFAGMMLSVLDFKFDSDVHNFRENAAGIILNSILPGTKYEYLISLPSPSESLVLNGTDAKFISFTASYKAKAYEAGSFYKSSGNVMAFCYSYKDKLISLVFPEYMINEASYIDELIQTFIK